MGVYLPLPNGYQEVEYIQSSGTQYINTGYTGSSNTKIDIKLSITTRVGNYDFFYGSSGDGTGGQPCTFIQNNYPENNKIRVVNYANSGSNKRCVDSINNLEYGKIYNIIHTNTNFIIDGVLQGTMSATTYSLTYPFWIFGVNNRGSFAQPCAMKLYSFKIYESGTLVRDFIPCYRKSDNVIGLYDLVNSQFYTNSGTGTFSKGADVTAMPLKNAYIGGVYEYSYDFRNKTTSQATADGWTLGSGVSIDTNGLYASTWSNTLRTITGKSTNAKKITLMCGLYNADTSNIDYSIWQATSGTINSTGVYIGGQEATEVMTRRILGVTTTYSFSVPSGAIEWTFILDLENLTWNTKIGTDVRNGTITQANANSLKANSNYLRIAYQYGSGRVQYVKFIVEK